MPKTRNVREKFAATQDKMFESGWAHNRKKPNQSLFSDRSDFKDRINAETNTFKHNNAGSIANSEIGISIPHPGSMLVGKGSSLNTVGGAFQK